MYCWGLLCFLFQGHLRVTLKGLRLRLRLELRWELRLTMMMMMMVVVVTGGLYHVKYDGIYGVQVLGSQLQYSTPSNR